jgi:hypothetical protein
MNWFINHSSSVSVHTKLDTPVFVQFVLSYANTLELVTASIASVFVAIIVGAFYSDYRGQSGKAIAFVDPISLGLVVIVVTLIASFIWGGFCIESCGRDNKDEIASVATSFARFTYSAIAIVWYLYQIGKHHAESS